MEIFNILRSAIGLCERLAPIHHRNEYYGNLCSDTINLEGDEGLPEQNIKTGLIYSQFTSPEQTGRINRQVDYRTDLYLFGIYLYQQLTG
jgi:hypothetical protein